MPVTASPLPRAVAAQAAELLRLGEWQKATDVIVDQLVTDGTIVRAKIEGGRVEYDPTYVVGGVPTPNTDEGGTEPRGFRRNRTTGELTAVPPPVTVGRAAFRWGVPWLHSSILHEYQHVEQGQAVRGRPTIASRVPGQSFGVDIDPQQDIEAYAEEIFNAHATRVDTDPREMRELWRRLHKEWKKLNWRDRAPVKDIYEKAHAVYVAVPGTHPETLGYQPFPKPPPRR